MSRSSDHKMLNETYTFAIDKGGPYTIILCRKLLRVYDRWYPIERLYQVTPLGTVSSGKHEPVVTF